MEEFKGKIVNASPLVEGGGEYQVQAEVENREIGWRLGQPFAESDAAKACLEKRWP